MNEATEQTAKRQDGQRAGRRRVALVGAGYIADWHAKCLPSVEGVELVAVCDRVEARARALAGKYGVAKAYGSLGAMLAAESLDAVHVLLPPDQHFDAAREAIEAGAGVLVEKPMGASGGECEELALLAAEHGVRLGVGHNFLFSRPYEQLRRDVRGGLLGPIDQIEIVWNRFLPQSVHGPFDTWMLREPGNMMLETGAHLMAFVLDLVGEPGEIVARASNSIVLPTGRSFYRRWQVETVRDATAIGLRLSYVPGFAEFNVHVRGLLGAATADIERNTYALDRYRAADPDFENHAMVAGHANGIKAQARRTLTRYVRSKLHLEKRGTPYGESIAGAMDAFYAAGEPDERISAWFGARVIAACERMRDRAGLEEQTVATPLVSTAPRAAAGTPVLVLGGTGFIGKEMVRQLTDAGRPVRLLVRNAASVPGEMRARVDCRRGDLLDRASLLAAMEGVACVVDLARANVKSWADYQKYEIEATRQVAECALSAGVKRFIYTGTIDSYYAGRKAGTITEATPLDPEIEHRNLYARAKAASEKMLDEMRHQKGLPLVIVRPGVVIGRGGSPFHWGVGMWWHEAVCQVWGKGENKLPLVLVEDVARGLIAAIDTPGIEGRSFNLAADPCLSAQEYLDELDRAGRMRVQRFATPIGRFYLVDMVKWAVKVAVRHPERRLPSYRDWESRTQQAHFDCSAAKSVLGWNPVSDRSEMVRRGIEEPLGEILR
jgi:predicted dehydrogenase/nucleoside-diphosphate-sugar epimerase